MISMFKRLGIREDKLQEWCAEAVTSLEKEPDEELIIADTIKNPEKKKKPFTQKTYTSVRTPKVQREERMRSSSTYARTFTGGFFSSAKKEDLTRPPTGGSPSARLTSEDEKDGAVSPIKDSFRESMQGFFKGAASNRNLASNSNSSTMASNSSLRMFGLGG